MRKEHKSLQMQIIGLSLCFALLIAVSISVVNSLYVQRNNRRSIAQSAEYSLQVTAGTIGQDISEINTLADWSSASTIVRNFVMYPLSVKDLSKNYDTIFAKYNYMRTARYVVRYIVTDCDTKFMQFGSMTSASRSLNIHNIQKFPGLIEGDDTFSWSTIFNDPLIIPGNSSVLPVVRSVPSKNQKNARIYIAVSTELITDSLKKYTLPENCALYWGLGERIFSISGDTMSPLENGFGSEPTPPPAELELQDPNTLFWQMEDGTIILGYPIGQDGMMIAQSIPKETFGGAFVLIRASLFFILLAILALGFLLGMLLRRIVAKPVDALQKQLTVISDGDFTPNPAIEWSNELGDVGRGINALSVSISGLMDKRIEDEKQKQDLEYRMLQSQINPHFLYNTLNSIKWMATIQNAPGIAEMTTSLSRLLKSVSKGNERLVPLQEEFALLNDYFTIQQYRYGGTIQLDVRYIEDETLCQNCMIPRFTLQPLVENAIFHGIEPKGCAGNIDLTIKIDSDTQDVLLFLSDDGIGMTQEKIDLALKESEDNSQKKYRQVGMINVHRRLQYIFGEQYGLSIESVLGEGTIICVRLPNSSMQESTTQSE